MHEIIDVVRGSHGKCESGQYHLPLEICFSFCMEPFDSACWIIISDHLFVTFWLLGSSSIISAVS